MQSYFFRFHNIISVIRLLTVCVILAAIPETAAQYRFAKPVPVQRTDFFLMLSDGVILDCTKFVPQSLMPPKGWPALLYCHGYADSKLTETANAEAQAAYGMYTFCYSMRGQGMSGGLSKLISTLEMNDLMQVIDYMKKDLSVNPDRIGIFGASQGGILPFMATCSGMNVRCILSDVCSPSFASNWMENGCVKMTLFFTVDYDSLTVRYDPEIKDVRRWILSKQTSAWDSLEAYLPKQRDFLVKVPTCATPVLLTNAWQDKFFDCSGVIKASSLLKVPFGLYCGAMDAHGADSTARENYFISKFDNAWIEYWLNNKPNGILDSMKFQYASGHYPYFNKRWSWTHEQSTAWPPEGLTPYTFYFKDSTLSRQQNTALSDTIGLRNTVRDANLTMQQAVDAQFTGVAFRLRFEKHTLEFTSEALQATLQLIGSPRLHLRYSSTADVCQYNFQIWEVKPTNEAHLVSRINFTNRHYKVGRISDTLITGIPHAHIFFKGDRIRVVVTNLDTNPDDRFLLTNPHVLPILKNAVNTIFLGDPSPTSLELPMRELAITDASPAQALAQGISLDQNYPNPFTGTTTVPFHLSKTSHVKMTVYDLLGRAVLTPLEETLASGQQLVTISFAAHNLPSGSYIVTISTREGIFSRTIQSIRNP
jgi:predicted acyl esterase